MILLNLLLNLLLTFLCKAEWTLHDLRDRQTIAQALSRLERNAANWQFYKTFFFCFERVPADLKSMKTGPRDDLWHFKKGINFLHRVCLSQTLGLFAESWIWPASSLNLMSFEPQVVSASSFLSLRSSLRLYDRFSVKSSQAKIVSTLDRLSLRSPQP